MEHLFTCMNCGTHQRPEGIEVSSLDGVLYWVCRNCGVAWPSPTTRSAYWEYAQALANIHNVNRPSVARTKVYP